MSFYVTTPIYYVNAEPHLGHAYTTIATDILARHMRQRGEDVFFLTGTDEHGEPVELAADREGITPQELADRNAPKFEQMMRLIEASNDFFIRTSDPRHVERVAEVMQRVYDNGHVYEGTYEGWYCPRCADFKTERELGPGNTCPIHEIRLEKEREENWFFRLSSFQDDLVRLYAERRDFVVPEHRYNEALSFIEQGLEDVSLSRPKLKWGMKLPWDQSQRMYVWFDALLNYVTALSFARDGEDLTPRYWPADYQVMAKDILKFHAVIWPALLKAADMEYPRRLAIHGFLLMGEKKMSKSLGNVLDPFQVVEQFGADALRHYCFREVSFGHDGSVSAAGFEERYEAELANEWGNLASRTLAMVERYRDGVVPEAAPDPALVGGKDGFEGLRPLVEELLDRAELTQALGELWDRVRRLNRYVEESRPWDLAKDESRVNQEPDRPLAGDRLDVVLYSLVEGVRVLALLLHPYMPATSDRLLDALGEEGREPGDFGSRGGGVAVERIPPLFPKLEPSQA
ncbi:MAG: methionine--tRNA ligase [Solirubrobacterales bacterium]